MWPTGEVQPRVERLPCSFTNRTRLVEGRVEKTYAGPARYGNAARERACLSALVDHLPVAKIVAVDFGHPRLTLGFVPGAHGQDLIEDGHARASAAARRQATLRTLQALEPTSVPGLDGHGPVIVRG